MKEIIKGILDLILTYIVVLATVSLMGLMAFEISFWLGIVCLLFLSLIALLFLYQTTIETLSPILAERRKRKAEVEKKIPKPVQIKKERKPKREKFEKREIFPEPEIISVKGEVMRELGLNYEKTKREEKRRELPIPQKRDENLLVQKEVLYLEKSGIFDQLIEKGEFFCPSSFHLGKLRGADVAVKLIKPTLKNLGIDFQIEFDEREARISLDKKARAELEEFLKKGQI
ncbi:MAG: hypothetical protein QME61_03125 [Patescibacteria group bacterium]|nr:hypothetical protein [Patescibacteria group bacterium]